MNNVVRLFGKLPVENPAAAKANVTTPVAEMLRMSDQLGCTVAEISKQLDAVGDLMCEVGDLETRSRAEMPVMQEGAIDRRPFT